MLSTKLILSFVGNGNIIKSHCFDYNRLCVVHLDVSLFRSRRIVVISVFKLEKLKHSIGKSRCI